MNGNKLKDISTTELIDELINRCNQAIFIGVKQEDGGTPTAFWQWQGHDGSCIGLCHQMAFYINRNMVYQETLDALEG